MNETLNNESFENTPDPQETISESVTTEKIEELNEISEIEIQDEPIATPEEELKKTIESLQTELEAYKSAAARQEAVAKQLDEFSELFPDIAVRSIPDEVWDSVKQGNTLAAAYSIYERRITEAARRIELINAKNAQKAAGVAGKDLTQEFFSADDVRKMSPNEVRANYAKIRRSMEKWN